MPADRRPWDARVAAWLVTPLRGTALTPNHLTTIRLIVGLFGAIVFALGRQPLLAALLVVLSNFLDHTDGEFARMTDQYSTFGHYYDLAADAIVTVGLFIGIGIGLRGGELGVLAILYGLIAGAAVATIFQIRNVLENRLGKVATRQVSAAGFEAEDVLYLLPLVIVFDVLDGFLVAAAIGAPLALALVAFDFQRRMRTPVP
ncbi:CDP-alcohol phosphatidyltransferase family protein [Nitrococcus mobilis]|uniref:CDP-alcohol phosphatidyltransferase n=1 Tax=Nitrococcus mobilis Nb-231 TaxID=314278 RepID=A4BTB3_9GAMM|nr:CDP-alcohol phosphatidyltransferase family protein [Nitrococcus mobilis]EAR21015.1 CDP-alcohol phosphatidyltransferase [Nitrococcus mobilis Nb-231]